MTVLADTSGGSSGETLVKVVYSRLRREILDGTLRPNQPLVEVELADRMKVSRMPIRESLQRLAVDGLVRSQRRRWVVHEHTKLEVCEMYEVRTALEGEAAALAARKASHEQVLAILSAGRSTLFSQAENRAERVANNEHFHNLIINAATNDRLTQMIERNSIFHFNQHVASLYSGDELHESGQQHEELARAIQKHDSDRARKIAIAHVEHALHIIMTKLY
ncbi:DNA-binding GntR family transcriptional regulator [Chelatococcus asaccharovorans]|uniref:DNA-binding GntR family transcriptional regulator n=2 Tax=Chelatococcus asaccharovorans TaxID=28210 RepID=A0A2V3TWZ3_9HYPH|nr:GntR family transcriptional regulator [Chelatococcus asaccharovorans]MBS7705111.1 GntR family transcriptional regulator [Chelatococcus asaccharovorans]PXW53603.1 DNA-binding GntR family transcriptional regulator [Chelatococcus asaccharovorans]CAH1652579.1 DNA-binding GntR family transcriptional regulator [Chelatococcus asaccharovorans]CAH1686293.1 DNA-binding GntR family transcriptional regulator [Chelatococcus asaccharovorans]